MNPSLLEQLLQQRAKVARPLPPSFPQNVWRQIRLRRAEESRPAVPGFWSWLARPQMATLVLAVAIGVSVGVASRPAPTAAAEAHQALDLQVFGETAAALPSTLLAHL